MSEELIDIAKRVASLVVEETTAIRAERDSLDIENHELVALSGLLKSKCDEKIYALCAELAAANAELAKYQPIPVSERMPDERKRVMLFDEIGKQWLVGVLVVLSKDNRYQWETDNGIYWHDFSFSRVTHWLPLPPAPEVKR